MRAGVVRWAALPITALLLLFNLRRLIFALAALGRNRRPVPRSSFTVQRSALILVPCRNEAAVLPGLMDSLARLDYPPDRLRVVLIDDGSVDATRAIVQRAADAHSGWHAIGLDVSQGKAQALNGALAQIDFGEIVVVYDADHRPEPGSLKRLVAVFDDPLVAGTSGRTRPINPTASLIAYYSTVESLVHQVITLRAKDRLNLAPALLGSNCAYRRRALEQAGGFRPGALLEDSDLTLDFARLGYRLRFVPGAVAWHQVPETVEGFVRQHVRWARGFNDVAREHAARALTDRRLPLRLRIELAMFSVGYLDRLALLAAMGLRQFAGGRRQGARGGRQDGMLSTALKIAFLMPQVQILVAFIVERVPRAMWIRLPAMSMLFGLDMLVVARAMVESVLDRPHVWQPTNRQRMGNG